MKSKQIAMFSPDGEYFVYCSRSRLLKIWETSSNKIKQEHELDPSINPITSLIWGPLKHESSSHEGDAVVNNNVHPLDHRSLIFGIGDGRLYSCNASTAVSKIIVSVHTDAVNDLCWHPDSRSLYTCSEDGSIAVWDYEKRKTIKLNADEAVYKICVIDSDNLLSANTSITWWNIKNQTIIRKFSGHETEIRHVLSVISTDKLSNSYFLLAAAEELEINAWKLTKKNNKDVVASFDLPNEIQNMDVSKYFSSDKPMYLSAVLKEGTMLLFKHVLNGSTRRNLTAQMTLTLVSSVDPKSSTVPIVASKLCSDSESCVIAYRSAAYPAFEKVEIENCPTTLTLVRNIPNECQNMSSEAVNHVKLYNKLGEYASANGTIASLHSVPKRKTPRKKTLNTSLEAEESSDMEAQSPDRGVADNSSPSVKKKRRKLDKQLPLVPDITYTVDDTPPDPTKIAEILLRGLQTEDRALFNMVLLYNDEEFIRKSVLRLPLIHLKFILLELHRKFSIPEERYNKPSLRKWLKEILSVHLQYLNKTEKLREVLTMIQHTIAELKVSETKLTMSQLRGVLNLLRIQNAFSDTSDSETEENMQT